jgi:hypothetical protein
VAINPDDYPDLLGKYFGEMMEDNLLGGRRPELKHDASARSQFYRQFSARLEASRRKKAYTIQQIAEKTGVAQPVVERVFNGKIDSVIARDVYEISTTVGYEFDELTMYLSDGRDTLNMPLFNSEDWTPAEGLVSVSPLWSKTAPGSLLIADEFIRKGRPFHEMTFRQFEGLVGDLLQCEGWNVTVMRGTKDGGIDVLAELTDPTFGPIRSIWQAKKYDPLKSKVQLCHIRELAFVLDDNRATKAIAATTSYFTRGALDLINQQQFRLHSMDKDMVEAWAKRWLSTGQTNDLKDSL